MKDTPPPIARVVEIGDTTAGIAVPDRAGGVLFFSAGQPFDRLDGRVFPGFEGALRAARDLLERRRPERPARPGQEAPADLVLAAYGPYPVL